FSESAASELAYPDRNVLVFIHGLDNSFANAITRAAFNCAWFGQPGVVGADTVVVAFSWPSTGELIKHPFPDGAYRHEQMKAGQSGRHMMVFFANLQPVLTAARANGHRALLLAHGLGVRALQAAVESWFVHGNGDTFLFDEALLVAADET